MTVTIINADCRHALRELPDASVHCCVTSPPYWGLRDYGVGGQIGLEMSAQTFVDNMVDVFREVRRVLRKDGTLWLNLGDSYAGGGNYRGLSSENTLTSKQRSNRGATGVSQQLGAVGKESQAKDKELVGIPWRVALALRNDGWYLRQDIIWHKPNPMPESVTDRCTKSHEYIFLLSKSPRYHFDAAAIAEASVYADSGRASARPEDLSPNRKCTDPGGNLSFRAITEKRNKRSVWTVPTAVFSEAHFATFPPDLIEPCILAGCPEGGTVLDPFGGAGTTGLVADRLQRHATLIELNTEYADLARKRIDSDAPLLAVG